MTVAVVAGALANKPRNGGAAWVRISWALGLARLGLEVWFLEEISRGACVDGRGRPAAFEASLNLRYFREVTARFGLATRSALVYEAGERIHGRGARELFELAEQADLLVNISGHLAWEPLKRRFRRRVFVDLDPGFTQLWRRGSRLDGHHHYLTVGENIGTRRCSLPTGGLRWRPVRQPVVLEQWPVSRSGDRGRFTTVTSWRGPYGPVEHRGRRFGLKLHEFRKYVELPRLVPSTFELALAIHPADRGDLDVLAGQGWRLADPMVVAGHPDSFRSYLHGSGAEFSVAQGVYVETRSGWFSDRSARYLASGKPVLVQDTGFGRSLPVGEGLVPFGTLREAVSGAHRIASDYERHARAARLLAEEHFDSDRVLRRLLEDVGVSP